MKPFALRTRLTLFYTAVFALLLAAFGTLSYHVLIGRLDDALTEELEERAGALSGYLSVTGGELVLTFNPDNPAEAYFIRVATQYYQVFNASTGALLQQSREMDLLGLALPPEEVRRLVRNPTLTEVDTDDIQLRFHNFVVRSGPNAVFLIQIGVSLAPLLAAKRQLAAILLLLGPLGLLGAGVAGYWVARYALQPVQSLSRAAQKIDIAQLHQRLPLRGSGDELDRLTDSFNQALARLEKAIGEIRQFTASISHELRTPLTSLRGEAEVALMEPRSPEEYRRVLVSQLEEFNKLTDMINHLLVLARAEAGEIRLARNKVELAGLARTLAEQMEPVAVWKEIGLRVEAGEPVEVVGDANWLERAILNLLDNALKFTPQGGEVELRVRRTGDSAELTVQDTGIGIAPPALAHIFERFYRADPSRSSEVEGAGLGLSLVQWIVEQHGGSVQVESQEGKGSCFTLRLPLAHREQRFEPSQPAPL